MDDGVGATLRKARDRRKVDLSEVEAATKIRVRYLRAIEREEWDVLPGETYARSFIRTYATFLGLDGERLADEHRRDSGVVRPAERLPRASPAGSHRRPGPRVSPRLLATIVSLALVAALVAIGLSSRDGDSPPSPLAEPGANRPQQAASHDSERPPAQPRGLSLHLTTTAEIWICLLDSAGRPLVDGQILASESEAGPFRSGSFTVSFGNGEVLMTVNGQQASIPATSSPIGYAIGAGGEMRELSEGERPTCT